MALEKSSATLVDNPTAGRARDGATTRPRAVPWSSRQRKSKPQCRGDVGPGLFAELADLMSQARHLPACGLLMNDAALGGPHELGFGGQEGRLGLRLFPARDRVLDQAQIVAHARTARLVDLGTARDLAGRLLGGLGVGHQRSVVVLRACDHSAAAAARKNDGG